MPDPLPLVMLVGLGLLALERVRPARSLPRVTGWWGRAALLNGCHLLVVVGAGLAWERRLPDAGLLDLAARLGPWGQGLVTYLVATFVYYWWHRVRHASPWLWRVFHQVHHAPRRLEVATAFYKHPAEAAANAVLSAGLAYPLLGCSPEGAAVYTVFAAGAEFFYHLNVRTPYWLGFLVQRPEAHRVHHQRGHHAHNYGDLPLWDMLFGTFHNPRAEVVACGFSPEREARLADMLLGRDVHRAPASGRPPSPRRRLRRQNAAALALLLLGSLQLAGAVLDVRALRGLGAASGAAPLPKVFTAHRGVETFATSFAIRFELDGQERALALGPEVYARLRGPYNRRNVYGAALAFAPVLPDALRDAVLRYGAAPGGPLETELGLPPGAREVRLEVQTKTQGQEATWTFPVSTR